MDGLELTEDQARSQDMARDQELLMGLGVSVITVVRAFHTEGAIKVVQL